MKAISAAIDTNKPVQNRLLVAQYPVSFHYGDKVESKLLYDILKFHRMDVNAGGGIFGGARNVCNALDLFRLWPKSSTELGGYGRALKDHQEAEAFLKFLSCSINVHADGNRCII